MKKTVLVVLMIALGASLLFATPQQEAGKTVEPFTLDIVSHRVHKLVATEGKGGDLITPFIEQHPEVKDVVWTILEIAPIHERLFREASLPSTEVDVGYVLDSYCVPNIFNLLEPLDGWQSKNPIEGFEDNFGKGMRDAFSSGGNLYGVPMRAASHGLGWNRSILADRGLSSPPKTPEEFMEQARKTTYTRSDGVKVYGLLAQSHFYTSGVNSIARMWDGDYIKSGFKIAVTDPAVVNAFQLYRDFYNEGILPQHIASIQHAEKQRMAQEGQGAFTFDVLGKIYTTFRNPDNKYADWDVAAYPLAKEIQGKYKFGPAQTAIWSMAVPKNAKHKDISWEYIRYISSARSSLVMALNGNGPVRASVFNEAEFKSGVPYSELAGQQALEARPMLPAFDKVNEIELVINEYIERVMLGQMTAKAGTQELAAKMKEISDLLK